MTDLLDPDSTTPSLSAVQSSKTKSETPKPSPTPVPAKNTKSPPPKVTAWWKKLLIALGVCLAVAGVAVGIYFGVKAFLNHSGSNVNPSTCPADKPTLCNGKCCQNTVISNNKCYCYDGCANIFNINGDIYCCDTAPYTTGIGNNQCCTDASGTSCIAGTPIS